MPFLLKDSFDSKNLLPFFSVIVFALGILLVYSFSTLYHWVKNPSTKIIFKKLDHISIYFSIAGTYTPIIVKFLDKGTAFIFLSIMWSLVLIGTIYKIFFINSFKGLSVLLFLIMGWMLVFVLEPLMKVVPLSIFWWILAGGLSYTIGVYFYVKSKHYYYHTIWHLFVLLGSILHYIAVYETIML